MPNTPSRDAILHRLEPLGGKPADTPADAPLDWDDIGFLCHGLAFASRPLSQASAKIAEQYSLGPRGAWMLNLISGGVVFPNELAEVFKIGRSLVTAELVRLSEAGLIESQPGKQDRRRSELKPTAAGHKAVAEVRAELNRIITAALTGYTPEQVRLCARMLRDMRENAAQL